MKFLEEKECFSFKPVELFELETDWNRGKLRNIEPSVKEFIEEQEIGLRNELGPRLDGDQISRILIDLLLTRGYLDQGAEMLAQKEEISKEIWICGERGDYDRSRIAVDWAFNHAEQWRRWRILTYIFIATKLLVQTYDDIEC